MEPKIAFLVLLTLALFLPVRLYSYRRITIMRLLLKIYSGMVMLDMDMCDAERCPVQ